MMYKVDLHTHSTASADGGISAVQYRQAIESGLLDCIAITDHNRIDFAAGMQQDLGEHIIIGEEIMTREGEIVGLFLDKVIKPGQTAVETIRQIKHQGGIVYVPHPFETVRKGLSSQVLEVLASQIEIFESHNGRAFLQNKSRLAVAWAGLNNKVASASSDAHGFHGLGKTYTLVSEMPKVTNILELLKSGKRISGRPSYRSLLYPKYHTIRRKIGNSR